MESSSHGRPTIFLDRDGTINATCAEWWKIDAWAFIDGAPEALALLQQHGFALALVTNQSGVARNLYTTGDVGALHAHMNKLLAAYGVSIDAIAICPHGAHERCACRKPASGMRDSIERSLGAIDYTRSWMIGDKESDIGFGAAIGVRTALLKSAYWREDDLRVAPDLIVDSLYDAAKAIVA